MRGISAQREVRNSAFGSPLAVAGAAALVAVVVYLNSLSNGFAYDDELVIRGRDLVHGIGELGRLLVVDYWPKDFSAGLYRPLTLLTYAVDWEIWNGEPFGFHLVNVLLHGVVTGLVVFLLLRYFPRWASLMGGLVFAVHSVHTEAVANVVGRAELLTAAFVLSACLIYIRAVRAGGISARSTLAIVGLYLAASFSKEAGVVLPGLLLVTDLPGLSRLRAAEIKSFIRKRLPLFAALTATLLLVFAVRWLVLGSPIQNQPDRAFAVDDSYATRFFTMTRIWPRYFELLLFPLELSADYSPAVILPVDHPTALGVVGLLLVLTVAGLAIGLYRRVPELAMAVTWATIGLLPVSNLIVMAEILLAERTLYLPSVAVSILVGMVLARVRFPVRRWVIAAVAAWIVVFSLVTVRRNPVWEDTNTVFEDLRREHPESSRLLFGVATMMLREGDWEEAQKWFDRSLEVWPHHAPSLIEYAFYLFADGQFAKADSLVGHAIRLRPEALQYRTFQAIIRYQAGDFQGARRVLERALDRLGDHEKLYALLADVRFALGEPARAVQAQRRALDLARGEPTWEDYRRLALFQRAAGDSAAAEATLERGRAAPGAPAGGEDSILRADDRVQRATIEEMTDSLGVERN